MSDNIPQDVNAETFERENFYKQNIEDTLVNRMEVKNPFIVTRCVDANAMTFYVMRHSSPEQRKAYVALLLDIDYKAPEAAVPEAGKQE